MNPSCPNTRNHLQELVDSVRSFRHDHNIPYRDLQTLQKWLAKEADAEILKRAIESLMPALYKEHTNSPLVLIEDKLFSQIKEIKTLSRS